MALNKTMTFDLELKPGGIPPIVHASQGDIGRMFKANIYWDGSAATSYISGATVNLRGRKPDKTVFDYSATLAGSMVTFETTEQMTIISGPVECELVFSNDGDIIASANFLLIVEASPYDPDALSESDVEGLTDVLESFQRLNRDSNGVVKIGDGVTASGTAEPIKGFYVHDELTDTDGVAKYDANALEGQLDALFLPYDINRAFVKFQRYVRTTGVLGVDMGSNAYEKIDVSNCDYVKIDNLYLEGARALVGIDENGTVTAIDTNRGTALRSGVYDVSGYKFVSFTGKNGTDPALWKYAPETNGGIIHGENYNFGFNLKDYEIKGTEYLSKTPTDCTVFDEPAICYGDNDKSLAIRGYTARSGHDPNVTININPIDAFGVQSFIVPVYTEDADKITLFYFGILKDGETAPTWFRQVYSLNNGWNYFRFDAIDYKAALSTWNNINGYRLLMRASEDATVYVGDIITVKPNKAKLVFICDHGYKNFMDVALPQFASRGFPVTFAMKLSLLGQSIEYASRILTEAEVEELAQNPMADVNIHSALSTPSSAQTAAQTKEDAWKGLYFLKKHGAYTMPYRAAWWQNNAPNADKLDDILTMSATYSQNDSNITVFPFADPHDVPRLGVHGADNSYIDGVFDLLKKTHGAVLMYTHDISDTIPPEGTNNINMTTAELNYLLSKIDTAVSEGWLEGDTIRGLYTRYAK